MNAPRKAYRVSVAPSGPGQRALIVRSLRVPTAVIRLEGFGSPLHARQLVDLAVAERYPTIDTRNATLYIHS